MFSNIKNYILSSQNIGIFTHINSDCDALGSSIALKLALESLGKNVQIFVQKPIHPNYNVIGVKEHVNKTIKVKFDLAIGLDCPDKKRFGIYQKKFESISKTIAIDHHADFINFADVNYCNKESSSTCLIIYSLIKYLNITITSDIAQCLYAGIATDTGRFLFGNLNKNLFEVVGDLYETGFDYLTINYNLFQKQTINEANLYKLGLSKLKLLDNGQIAYLLLDKQDFLSTNTMPHDTYKILDYMQCIDGVKICCIATENDENEFMVSFRSRIINVQKVAKIFGGGGHIKAAGCKIFDNKINVEHMLINACKKSIN